MIHNSSSTYRLFLILLVFCFFAGGCEEPVPHYNRLQGATFIKADAHPYGSVAVYPNADAIKRPYEILGMLSCEGSSGEEAGILNAMLYRAADMGGDGLLLGVPKNGTESLPEDELRPGWATTAGNGNRRGYRSWVVRLK